MICRWYCWWHAGSADDCQFQYPPQTDRRFCAWVPPDAGISCVKRGQQLSWVTTPLFGRKRYRCLQFWNDLVASKNGAARTARTHEEQRLQRAREAEREQLLLLEQREALAQARAECWLLRLECLLSGKPTGYRENQGYGRIPRKCTLTKFDMGNGAKGIPPYPRSLRIPACLFVQFLGPL